MDIFINGKQGAGKTRAAKTILKNFSGIGGRALHASDVLYIHNQRDLTNVRLLVEMIRAARVRAVVFDESIADGAHLLIAVQAVKEYRAQINADILAIYVQQAEVVSAKYLSEEMPHLLGRYEEQPIHAALQDEYTKPKVFINLPTPSDEQLAEIKKAFEDMGKPIFIGADFAKYVPASERATIQYVSAVTAEGSRYPLTWDNTKQAFQAADLEDGGKVICSAVNVYAFNGALKLGDGKRSKRFMLFELAEVVPVSNLHVAVDRMNTHYFETRTFEKRAFNAKNVRPATPSEVLEYLNAKYKYERSL